jgi:hypothetical protein
MPTHRNDPMKINPLDHKINWRLRESPGLKGAG